MSLEVGEPKPPYILQQIDGTYVVSVARDCEAPDHVLALFALRLPHPCGRDHLICQDLEHARTILTAME